ncbi:MAG TPA: TolC family protein [Acidobacteriaceae bacterium]|nr:TolC family protein [Acidobacteriaceae bacterium]
MKTTTLWLRAALITTYALAGLPAVSAQTPVVPQATDASMPQTATPAITLNDAITRARANEPTFANAVATAKNAKLDQSIARAALLPNVSAENQFLYTQGGAGVITNPIKAQQPDLQTTSAPRFIANNAVHEYINQAVVTETIGGQQFNALSKASASLAVANAELQIAERGLVVTVAGLYYAAATAERRVAVAQRAADEAAGLTKLTSQREQAREVAHADVVKAQLQQQQRDRDLSDAKLNAAKARLDLGVLLFPDPRTPYTVAIPDTAAPVPARAEVEAALAKNNPELRSALAGAHLADLDVISARLGYLPDLTLNYNYGIDSPQFGLHNDLGDRNLGYSASAQLNFPIWDWFTTHDKVKQSENSRTAARATLTNTQRKTIAELEEFYSEAIAAHDQLDSLELSAKTAAESLRLVRLAYTAGEAKILDVVDAENSLTSAEQAREDGVVRYETALANLQLLTGTL